MSLGPEGRAARHEAEDAGPGNEVEVELAMPVARVRSVMLRRFTFGLLPLPEHREEGDPVDGLAVYLEAKDIGLKVSARFERSEFVNLATAGLRLLDAADATELPEGGEFPQ